MILEKFFNWVASGSSASGSSASGAQSELNPLEHKTQQVASYTLQQQGFLEEIHLNAKHADAYHKLGKTLEKDGKITLYNGRTMTKLDLYLTAIDLQSHVAPKFQNRSFYTALLELCPEGGRIRALNGKFIPWKVICGGTPYFVDPS